MWGGPQEWNRRLGALGTLNQQQPGNPVLRELGSETSMEMTGRGRMGPIGVHLGRAGNLVVVEDPPTES